MTDEIAQVGVGIGVLNLDLLPGEFPWPTLAVTVVRLTTKGGVVGHGYAYAWNVPSAQSLEVLAIDMAKHLIGRDVMARRQLHAVISREYLKILGPRGMAMHGLSAIDIAMWDCASRSLGLPLQAMLGTDRATVPAYLSGAGLGASPAEAAAAASRLVTKFEVPALKMLVPPGSISREIARVAAVREAIGPQCALMLDARGGYSVRDAIKLSGWRGRNMTSNGSKIRCRATWLPED